MKQTVIFFFILFYGLTGPTNATAQPKPSHNLVFEQLPGRWDEGLPIGNGWLGALIWQKADRVRLSLDRVDLWDGRPMPVIDRLKFSWVVQQVKARSYDTVQAIGDRPYDTSAAPTKIPGAALEFNCTAFGKVEQAELDISTGLATVAFANGTKFLNYVHATRLAGYFGFEKLPGGPVLPELKIPAYQRATAAVNGNKVVDGQGLVTLGYGPGTVSQKQGEIRYHQPTYDGHYYEVLVRWKKSGTNGLVGCWTISIDSTATLPVMDMRTKEPTYWPEHLGWWQDYWGRSSVSLPDPLLEKQYYLDMYKFGSVTRSNTPPISLQAVWTADNGNLPPWKGDLHHDLNTQLSYWPGYVSNHTDLTASYTNWIWKVRKENRRWTQQYFGVEGINVPGVTTISGKPMGGWIQYSMGPTVAAWLCQHFYQQYVYTGDRRFLKEKCLPYFKEVDAFLSALAVRNEKGRLQLPLSASPEINDNSVDAWFLQTTNYDLALIRNFYRRYAALLEFSSGQPATALREKERLWAALDQDESGLTIAPGHPLKESHRHHSNLMAIYPLRVLSKDSVADRTIIDRSLANMQKLGTRAWVGYSFAWAGSLYAAAGMGDSALRQLKIFAENFCSPNSFHLNGDQKGGQYSGFTYRPFTLEGNFAFAQGIHEMLLQSEGGYVHVFPALPAAWKWCRFAGLRACGAFLVDAEKENGVPVRVRIRAEKDGRLRLKLPFKTFLQQGIDRAAIQFEPGGILAFNMKAGQAVVFENAYE